MKTSETDMTIVFQVSVMVITEIVRERMLFRTNPCPRNSKTHIDTVVTMIHARCLVPLCTHL